MPKPFLKLSAKNRREALEVAAASLGRPPHLLEKDVWVVWALQTLFSAPFCDHLVFKGGTSLSKGYGLIRRFSEDVDLTYDIRALAPDLAGDDEEPLPQNRSQEKKWTAEIRARLPHWIEQQVRPSIQTQLDAESIPLRLEHQVDKLFLHYKPVTTLRAYVKPAVLLEFGARSTGEPSESRLVVCDTAAALSGLTFPEATVRVMRAERTFWEKATAMHVYCRRGRYRGGERFARHWHDVARLHEAGIVANAAANHALAEAVAHHKGAFFAEKDEKGEWIDYLAAVNGGLQLVPSGEAWTALAIDYALMVEEGLLLDAAESFDTLMARIKTVEVEANERLLRTIAGDASKGKWPAN